jgi:hypothetical protein
MFHKLATDFCHDAFPWYVKPCYANPGGIPSIYVDSKPVTVTRGGSGKGSVFTPLVQHSLQQRKLNIFHGA